MGQVIERAKTTIKVTLGHCKCVGQDRFGNTYFQSTKIVGDRKARWVLYNGVAEPSKVPPMWHGWLHYTLNTPPIHVIEHPWQKEYVPNLTGTALAYKPQYVDAALDPLYHSWEPNNPAEGAEEK